MCSFAGQPSLERRRSIAPTAMMYSACLRAVHLRVAALCRRPHTRFPRPFLTLCAARRCGSLRCSAFSLFPFGSPAPNRCRGACSTLHGRCHDAPFRMRATTAYRAPPISHWRCGCIHAGATRRANAAASDRLHGTQSARRGTSAVLATYHCSTTTPTTYTESGRCCSASAVASCSARQQRWLASARPRLAP